MTLDEDTKEVIQAWRDMSEHVKACAQWMMRLAGSQEETARAARASASSVRLAAWSFVFVAVIGGIIIGMMVHSSNVDAAAHREGARIQSALIEKRIEETRDLVLECRRLGLNQETTR
jgi:hypothetical protein